MTDATDATGRTVVVVGAGLAGVQTAVRLRELGWRGGITLLGAEPHRPYDRPPLSKDVLLGTGETAGRDAGRAVAFDVDFDELAVELRLGVAATGLDTAARVVDTEAGPLPYDHLVLATGAAARSLPGVTPDGNAHLLRTLDDARRLRPVLDAGGSLVVVGAGWIGAEVTTAARRAGCPVTVVEAADQPLPGALPAEVAAPMRAWYKAAGAELLTGRRVAAVRDGEVELDAADTTAPAGGGAGRGAVLGADAVVVGVGSRPATDWLAGSGVELAPDGSVLADELLRTSAPGVFAVGDCASFPSRRYGRRLTVHHWDNALAGPRTVAAAIVGHPHDQPPAYDPVPYFWSEQFDHYVQYAGRHEDAHRLLWRGDPAGGEGWTVCWLGGGDVLVALLAVDRPRDAGQGRRLMERGARLDPGRAADPAVPLRAAVR